MNISQDSFNDSLGDFSAAEKDKKLLPNLIDSFSEYCELSKRVENIKLAAKFADTFDITELEEEFFQHILPALVQVFKEVFEKNCELSSSNHEQLQEIRYNFQIASSLIQVSTTFLKPICDKDRCVQFCYIPSLPNNIAQIVFSSFEHCKNSQKIYSTNFDSIVEILELFRNTQSLHSKLLNVLEAKLEFNSSSENDRSGLTLILDSLCKISSTISGLNARSMSENWKAYTALNKKYSEILHKVPDFDFNTHIKTIVNEIEENFNILKTLERSDIKTSTHLIKVTGFLTKVALKLFELNWEILEYKEVISFYVVIHSCPSDYFTSKNFPDEFLKEFNLKFTGIIDQSLARSLGEDVFLRHLTSFNNSADLSISFGHLSFLNHVLKVFGQGSVEEFDCIDLDLIVNVIFNLTSCCFCELSTFDLSLFDELIVNLSALILTLPDLYPKVEVILLKNILQEEIWPAMLAIDVWSSILGNSPAALTCRIITNLLSKIDYLNLGIITQTPHMIYLKIFIRRIFHNLPDGSKNELISKYSPSVNLPVWKYLELRAIPLSQRFQIETVLIDLYEKTDCMQEGNLEDLLFIAETLNIASCVDFGAMHLNTTAVTKSIGRLWAFNSFDLQLNNNLFKYFITKLVKITKSLIYQFASDVLLLILNQIKVLSRNVQQIFKILANEIIQPLASSPFDHYSNDKSAILNSIYEIFLITLNDKNGVIAESALATFRDFSSNEDFSLQAKKIRSNAKIAKLYEKYEENSDFDVNYFKKLSQNKLEHRCIEWMTVESSETICESPQKKKIRIEEEVDVVDDVISGLKNEAKRLQSVIKTSRLSPKQVRDVRAVISRLEMLI